MPRIDLAWGRETVASPRLAAYLGTDHDALMMAIRALRCDESFHRRCFIPATRKRQPIFRITKDGFVLLALALERAGAAPHPEWIEAVLEAFAEAEARMSEPRPPKRRQRNVAAATAQSGPAAAPAIRPDPGQPMPVPFRGATLYVVEHEGEPYVPMRPVVEGMGLAWQAQHEKLKAERFASTITEIVMVAQDGKRRAMTSLPLRKLAGWLMTIYPDKVRPELRDKILAYQNECDDVLWRYWTEGRVGRSASFRAADQQEEAPRAGPFVLDDAFVARVYVALGRKAVQTEVLRRLLLMGALENWVCVSAREIARLHPPISSSAAHKAAHLLKARGILAMEDGGPYRPWRYRICQQALTDLLARVGQVHLHGMERGLTERLYERTPGRKPLLH